MATLGTLIRNFTQGIIHGDLPPVGEKIQWRGKHLPLPTYEGFDAYWVDSGTSALALTIIAAKQLRPETKQPEVILPAYGCPDLVAAAVYAKVQPVLVDISLNDPGYDLEQLNKAINENTIAVVAVNFLGIRDRLEEIKALLPKTTYLIEDNAQCYEAIAEPSKIVGDFAITSFGRGKPVSLLGGGVTLIRKKASHKLNLNLYISPSQNPVFLKVEIAIYNLLLKPQLYQLINRCPFIKLGETHYHPLYSIKNIDALRASLLSINIKSITLQTRPEIKKPIINNDAMLDLAITLNKRTIKLLRHPIILNEKHKRRSLIKQSREYGVGCTTMYQSALININKISNLVTLHSTKNALKFSSTLITLPTKITEYHYNKFELCQLYSSEEKTIKNKRI